jgi:hypothetical protein
MAIVGAQETGPGGGVSIETAVVARSVEEREPVGEATSFPADVGELACLTRVAGASGETSIQHVWFHGSEELARVRLAVRGSSWRTWSTKQILPSWTGAWKVEIQDADGNVLHTVSFTVGTEGAAGGA